MDTAGDLQKVALVPTVTFNAPEGFAGSGLFIGGGWHQLTAEGQLVLPAEGNWAALSGIGFVEATTPDPAP